ncbi:hypothetical protein JTE90_015370 [Oedothorax gibbosus]|uniref:peptidyl-tRNA hydrolase n=1 Tax=Oedothorax gibbosus TaxID=931172 RepID=A0AAV6U4C2_9ARAC|nr:hypothetical protein JTE90_015370 [Oedothorax gibbosus]
MGILEGSSLSSVATNVCALGCGIVLGCVMKNWIKAKSSIKDTSMDDKIADEVSFSDFAQGDLKLVLVVQNGLKMGKGKIAAQCSHASVMAFQHCSARNPQILKKWVKSGQRKVVVKVEDEEQMLDLAVKAKRAGLVTSIVCDAGRTQIPSGSKTVLGVGPGNEQLIDSITGHLKLL